jgi:hypothetical protein
MRSHVPAPINTVHTHPAAAIKPPMTVLLTPVVIAQPAQNPMPMLLTPLVLHTSALNPMAVLLKPLELL